MKNLSLVLNAVLLVAVAVLYYFTFKSPSGSSNSDNKSAALGDVTIAYISSDSVLKYYDYLKENKVIIEEKSKKMDTDFRNRAQSLQSEITAYQRNVSNLTIGQAKALEEDLTKKQQNLQMYQQSLSQELMNDEAKLNQELYKRITDFLKTYSEQNGLQVVFKYDVSSDVLFGNKALDITDAVVKGLNEAYATEKQNPAPAAEKK
jgi:outer membrane protein